MHEALKFLQDAIVSDILQGVVVDVDRYCRLLAPIYRHLLPRDLQGVVLGIVGRHGGCAVWGESSASELPPRELADTE